MTPTLTLNIILAAPIFAAVLGLIGWGIVTAGRDHPATASAARRRQPRPESASPLDNNIAVGFYTDNKGVNHGYSYKISSHSFRKITVSGDSNVTTAAINDLNDVAGFATNSAGTTEAFLRGSPDATSPVRLRIGRWCSSRVRSHRRRRSAHRVSSVTSQIPRWRQVGITDAGGRTALCQV